MEDGSRTICLKQYRNESKVCRNPHKGWYHHYYDNSITSYGGLLKPGDFLEDFPGLNHIYLRLAWSYLEPAEGRYNWDIIDRVIDDWVPRRYGVAFRITCKETSREQVFATPEWVKDSGAIGEYCANVWSDKWLNWGPDYDDPIFLRKLENFHAAFAARYDGKPWVEYVDIGSYGDWGEGHTQAGSKRHWPVTVLMKHVDLYLRHYAKSILFINDDHAGCQYQDAASMAGLVESFFEKGLALRDDSVCVLIYQDRRTGYSTLRFPEMFERFWRRRPIDLELDHYADTKLDGTWKGGLPFLAAVEQAHATFIGFHGNARLFLEENADLVRRLANRAGYWYTIDRIQLPETLFPGRDASFKMSWVNLGVAPSYYRYNLELLLQKPDDGSDQSVWKLDNIDNRNWMPGETVEETGIFTVSSDFQAGRYRLKIGLFEDRGGCRRPIELAMHDAIKDSGGYYEVAQIDVGVR